MKLLFSAANMLPADVANLTFDQLWVLLQDVETLVPPKGLSQKGNLVTGTIEDLIAQGILPPLSVMQRRAKKEQSRQKRERRQSRRQEMKRFLASKAASDVADKD